jgi:pimeloyl-ACP methyl ester carboxylesterase
MRDASVSPERQSSMIARLSGPEVVEIDAGHLVMLSKPEQLAAVLARVSGSE